MAKFQSSCIVLIIFHLVRDFLIWIGTVSPRFSSHFHIFPSEGTSCSYFKSLQQGSWLSDGLHLLTSKKRNWPFLDWNGSKPVLLIFINASNYECIKVACAASCKYPDLQRVKCHPASRASITGTLCIINSRVSWTTSEVSMAPTLAVIKPGIGCKVMKYCRACTYTSHTSPLQLHLPHRALIYFDCIFVRAFVSQKQNTTYFDWLPSSDRQLVWLCHCSS